MKNQCSIKYALFLGIFALFFFASLLYASTASTALNWWVIAGGGRHITSGNTTLEGTLGQPLAYQQSSGNTELCAGFWCGTAVEYAVYLPAIMNQVYTCFAGPSEIEPNDTFTQANGPLCSGVSYTGSPDDHGSAADNDY